MEVNLHNSAVSHATKLGYSLQLGWNLNDMPSHDLVQQSGEGSKNRDLSWKWHDHMFVPSHVQSRPVKVVAGLGEEEYLATLSIRHF